MSALVHDAVKGFRSHGQEKRGLMSRCRQKERVEWGIPRALAAPTRPMGYPAGVWRTIDVLPSHQAPLSRALGLCAGRKTPPRAGSLVSRARVRARARAQRCFCRCRWRRCRSPLLTRRQSLAFLSSRLSPGPTRNSHPASHLRPHNNNNKQAPAASDVAKRAGAAAAAALLALSPLAPAALANEFDVLGEPTPTNYFFDDAGVLSKSTRSQLNKKLSLLEVRARGARARSICFVSGAGGGRPAAALSFVASFAQRRPTQQTNTTNQHNKPTNNQPPSKH